MATISRIKVWADGEVLFANDLDSEFDNLVNGVNSITNDQIADNAAIDPAKISGAIKGDGIARDSGTGALSVKVDNVGLQVSGDEVQLKDLGVPGTKFSDSVAGNGVIKTRSTGALNASVDFSTIRTSPNYRFTITSGSATAGATYTNNSQVFTVLQTVSSGTVLYCSGTGTPEANEVATLNNNGTTGDTTDDYYTYTYVTHTLTKASGTGDGSITYSFWKTGYLEIPVGGITKALLPADTIVYSTAVSSYTNSTDYTTTGAGSPGLYQGTDVSGLSLSFTASGIRHVVIGLEQSSYSVGNFTNATTNGSAYLQIRRSGSASPSSFTTIASFAANGAIGQMASACSFKELPAADTYTYKVTLNTNGTGTAQINNLKLYAYEL